MSAGSATRGASHNQSAEWVKNMASLADDAAETEPGFDRLQIRMPRLDERMPEVPPRGALTELRDQRIHVLPVGAADFIGLDFDLFAGLHVDELRDVDVGQIELVGIHDLQQQHVVSAMQELPERIEQLARVAEEIREDDKAAALLIQRRALARGGGDVGLRRRPRGFQLAEQIIQMPPGAARREELQHAIREE